MDHSRAPVLEALQEFRRRGDVVYGPPGHKQGRGADPRGAAFFAPVQQVPIDEAVGRVVAEEVSPYPPGVPVLAPGERITQEVVDYLRTGVQAGMLIPDAADSSMESLRVVAE
jgi:arginine decarboxylase